MQFEPFTAAAEASVTLHVSTPWPGATNAESVP
jgi:hypothetical protein